MYNSRMIKEIYDTICELLAGAVVIGFIVWVISSGGIY